jgi:hypothetical protein
MPARASQVHWLGNGGSRCELAFAPKLSPDGSLRAFLIDSRSFQRSDPKIGGSANLLWKLGKTTHPPVHDSDHKRQFALNCYYFLFLELSLTKNNADIDRVQVNYQPRTSE